MSKPDIIEDLQTRLVLTEAKVEDLSKRLAVIENWVDRFVAAEEEHSKMVQKMIHGGVIVRDKNEAPPKPPVKN